jgi:hypothetical protein
LIHSFFISEASGPALFSFFLIYSLQRVNKMNLFRATSLLLALLQLSPNHGFAPASLVSRRAVVTASRLQSSEGDEERTKKLQEIIKEETSSPVGMAAAAEQMKNIKLEDLERMAKEMDNMNPIQRGALKAMGMDPERMKKSMEMMRDNPAMVESAKKIMQNMSPEELMEQSRMAQQRMASMTPEQFEETNKGMGNMGAIPQEQIDKAVDLLKQKQEEGRQTVSVVDAEVNDDDDDDDEESSSATMETGPGSSSDPEVIDAMFRVAELLSDPPSGSTTFAGFASLPVIQLLNGDREADLSPEELKECWADGSLGATRVDRVGFERVWKEVQDYFVDDIMGEARKEAKKVASTTTKPSSSTSTSTPTTTTPAVTIGQSMDPEQLKAVNERVKTMSEDEVGMMLEQMGKSDPAQEARMKAMGIDPAMMQKTAKMMKDNPMMRQAAQAMMKNLTPEQMLQASQQAQQQMSGMSQEDITKAMDAQFGNNDKK